MKDINDVVTVGEVAQRLNEDAEVIRFSDATFLADPRMVEAIDNMDDAIRSGRGKAAVVTTSETPVVNPGEIVPIDPGEDTVGPSGIVR